MEAFGDKYLVILVGEQILKKKMNLHDCVTLKTRVILSSSRTRVTFWKPNKPVLPAPRRHARGGNIFSVAYLHHAPCVGYFHCLRCSCTVMRKAEEDVPLGSSTENVQSRKQQRASQQFARNCNFEYMRVLGACNSGLLAVVR